MTMTAVHVAFLEEAARYFKNRDTKGEDRAHWSNVYNAENCLEAASALTQQEAEIARLQGINERAYLASEKLQAERDELQRKLDDAEDALKQVLASLVAVTSIVIRAEDIKQRPSKAVGSDAMFYQMLKDYDAATIAGRAALSQKDEGQ